VYTLKEVDDRRENVAKGCRKISTDLREECSDRHESCSKVASAKGLRILAATGNTGNVMYEEDLCCVVAVRTYSTGIFEV
jgi:hypothetical protein